jgi:hypothetical protein
MGRQCMPPSKRKGKEGEGRQIIRVSGVVIGKSERGNEIEVTKQAWIWCFIKAGIFGRVKRF